MINLTNLTMQQVIDLEYEAAKAGDQATENDCVALYYSYVDSKDATLVDHIRNECDGLRAIAERIAKAVNAAEAQVQIQVPEEKTP